MDRTKIAFGFVALVAFTASPVFASVCPRCYGVGIDAPAVAAVSSAMFALLVAIVLVFGGFISFFRNVISKEVALEDGQCRPALPESSDQ